MALIRSNLYVDLYLEEHLFISATELEFLCCSEERGRAELDFSL